MTSEYAYLKIFLNFFSESNLLEKKIVENHVILNNLFNPPSCLIFNLGLIYTLNIIIWTLWNDWFLRILTAHLIRPNLPLLYLAGTQYAAISN